MTDLSPAAQATWCAYEQVLEAECVLTKTDVKALAAALRAAADQVVPKCDMPLLADDAADAAWDARDDVRDDLLSIAAELEALANG